MKDRFGRRGSGLFDSKVARTNKSSPRAPRRCPWSCTQKNTIANVNVAGCLKRLQPAMLTNVCHVTTFGTCARDRQGRAELLGVTQRFAAARCGSRASAAPARRQSVSPWRPNLSAAACPPTAWTATTAAQGCAATSDSPRRTVPKTSAASGNARSSLPTAASSRCAASFRHHRLHVRQRATSH